MAEKWDISPDGLVYTFKLRDNVPWVKWDGRAGRQGPELPDEDGNRTAWSPPRTSSTASLRTLKPETASPYAYVLAFVLEGADEFNTGAITDTDDGRRQGHRCQDPRR